MTIGRWIAAAAIALAAFSASAARGQANLVPNAGFERGTDGWAYALVGAEGTGALDATICHAGEKSFRMTHKTATAPDVYSRLVRGVAGLKPETAYRIGGWVKGDGVGPAWIGGGPGWAFRVPVPTGTYEWTHVEGHYLTGKGEAGFDLMVLCDGRTNQLWIDDLELVEAPTEKTQSMRADAAAKAAAIAARPGQELERLKRLEALAAANAAAGRDPYVDLGLGVAKRFLDRVRTRGPNGDQADDWQSLQVEEVGQVLDETDARLADPGRAKVLDVAALRRPPAGRPAIRDGLLELGGRPTFFGGYGHFGSVFRDLAEFPALGASVVQDGRVGPSAMNADGSLGPEAVRTIDDVTRAAAARMKVDFLVSPHFFPAWAKEKWPDIAGPGGLGYRIDHPKAREVNERWLRLMATRLKGNPGLLSYCLSNEPTHEESGRDPWSAPLWPKWLRKTHGTLANLNAVYGTRHASFEAVPVPGKGMPNDLPSKRVYYDWVRFNAQHWADFHAWERGVLRSVTPDVPTHAKIMAFFTLDQDKVHQGVDPELFCEATDLAGCDAYAFPSAGGQAYDWIGHEFFYDLLHSFRGQPIFNSENHLIPDGTAALHVPAELTRAALWQGGLHHQAATTIWVWEEPSHPSLVGSIYFRPANVRSAGQAMFDLNRLTPEVAAIARAKPRVALLYSPTSVFWEPKYKEAMFSAYRMLNFLGEPVTFVSEKQLAAGLRPDVKWVVLSRATHVTDAAATGLSAFANRGGRILALGEGNLAVDEYHRPRASTAPTAVVTPAADESETANSVRAALTQAGVAMPPLTDLKTGKPTWGVEHSRCEIEGSTLLPAINLTPESKTASFGDAAAGGAIDLLSGETVDLRKVELKPMVPRLLKCR